MRERLDDLARLLAGHRYIAGTEADLQEGMASVLSAAGEAYVREFHLSPGDRPDFWFSGDGIAVEVKIGGSRSDVLRQAHRYAAHPDVRAVLIVSTRVSHANVPDTLNGKPVASVWLSGQFL